MLTNQALPVLHFLHDGYIIPTPRASWENEYQMAPVFFQTGYIRPQYTWQHHDVITSLIINERSKP